MAPVVNDCRTYLFTDPEMLRLLLESGMDPNLPSWLHTTPLHDLCARDSRGRPRRIVWNVRPFCSTRDRRSPPRTMTTARPRSRGPPGTTCPTWSSCCSRGAPVSLPDDDPWATPLAWATRRGHDGIVAILRAAGATVSG